VRSQVDELQELVGGNEALRDRRVPAKVGTRTAKRVPTADEQEKVPTV
jgi:hypothetical protein